MEASCGSSTRREKRGARAQRGGGRRRHAVGRAERSSRSRSTGEVWEREIVVGWAAGWIREREVGCCHLIDPGDRSVGCALSLSSVFFLRAAKRHSLRRLKENTDDKEEPERTGPAGIVPGQLHMQSACDPSENRISPTRAAAYPDRTAVAAPASDLAAYLTAPGLPLPDRRDRSEIQSNPIQSPPHTEIPISKP